MADRFWVGNGGNYSDNTNHWSASTGGAPGASLPTSADNVFFDANSFNTGSQTVTVNVTSYCLSMDWTNVTDTPELYISSHIYIYGGLTFVAGMTLDGIGGRRIRFYATSGSWNIDTAGKTLIGYYDFNGDGTNGGTWILTSDLIWSAGDLVFSAGSLDFNGYNVTGTAGAIWLNSAATRTLSLGSGTITLFKWQYIDVTNLTFNAETSTVIINGTTVIFNGAGLTWNNVEIKATIVCTIEGSSTFNILSLNRGSAQTVKFTAGTTQTVTSFVATGTAGNVITIESTLGGSAATLSDDGGTNACEWLSLKDSEAIGGATWNALNSIDVSGNSGWNISAPSVGLENKSANMAAKMMEVGAI